jgi:hypothetical protein
MNIYEQRVSEISGPKDPAISVTRWSIATDVQLIGSQGHVTSLFTMSPGLATKVGWALLEAAVAKASPEDAA